MDWYHYQFVGMHFFWWMFWVILIVAFFSLAIPVRRKTVWLYRENPFGILQRRYAAGEITTEEYEQRKDRIARDSRDPKLQPFSRTPLDQNLPG
jgi:putative membrane protein